MFLANTGNALRITQLVNSAISLIEVLSICEVDSRGSGVVSHRCHIHSRCSDEGIGKAEITWPIVRFWFSHPPFYRQQNEENEQFLSYLKAYSPVDCSKYHLRHSNVLLFVDFKTCTYTSVCS